MNYETVYINFISRRLHRGLDKSKQKLAANLYEKHHILPRSLGGGDEKSNLVLLTCREHFSAHVLLTMFLEGKAKYKMLHAVGMMSAAKEKLSAVAYEVTKLAQSIAITNRNNEQVAEGKHIFQNEEFICNNKLRAKEQAALGLLYCQTPESRLAQSKIMLNRSKEGLLYSQSAEYKSLLEQGLLPCQTPESRLRASKACKDLVAEGKHNFQTPEARLASSEAQLVKVREGKHHFQSEEHKRKTSKLFSELSAKGLLQQQSESSRLRQSALCKDLIAEGKHNFQSPEHLEKLRLRSTTIVTCPHCGKEGKEIGMKSWHFDNCKLNPAKSKAKT